MKIRLQNQTSTRGDSVYKGPIDCIKQIVKKDGTRGMFKALPTTLLREAPSYGGMFNNI